MSVPTLRPVTPDLLTELEKAHVDTTPLRQFLGYQVERASTLFGHPYWWVRDLTGRVHLVPIRTRTPRAALPTRRVKAVVFDSSDLLAVPTAAEIVAAADLTPYVSNISLRV